MRIAFIIPTLDKGGAQRVVSRLSQKLSEKYDVHIILFNDNVTYPYKARLHILNNNNNKLLKGTVLRYLSNIIKVYKIKKKYKFDIVISFLSLPNLINIFTKQRSEKVVISVRNYITREYKHYKTGKALIKLVKKFYRKADLVLSVSDGIKEDLIENYSIPKNKVLTIYNPYEIDEIVKMGLEDIEDEFLKWKGNSVLFINVGRLEYQKNQKDFIRIINEIYKDGYDVKGLIIGDGSLKNELDDMIRARSLDRRVKIISFKENPFKYMRNSDVYLLTSYFEGFPNALVEAMISGCVIVSSDCKTGPGEILIDTLTLGNTEYGFKDYGYLFSDLYERDIEQGSIYEIESIIKNDKIMADMKLRASIGAERFAINKIISQWENMINDQK